MVETILKVIIGIIAWLVGLVIINSYSKVYKR